MNTYLVYCHTNMINGKQYVGLTSMSIEERAGTDGTRYRNCRVFYNAIQKYGWDNFAHKVLAYDLTHEMACELEKHYIELYNTQVPNGYNLTDGGDGGFHHSEIVRQAISEKNKGNKSRTGYKNSEEMNAHMSNIMKGNTYGKNNGRPVIQLTLDGEFVAEYPSSAEATRVTGIGHVKHAVQGKLKSAGGYLWKRKGQ